MFYAPSSLDSFNKTTRTAQGTLIQNWQEERVLRDETGEGRTLSKIHVAKNHEDLFRKPVEELQEVYTQGQREDETFGRVFGRKQDQKYISEYRDKHSKRTYIQEPTGKKLGLVEQEYLNQINQELNEKNRNTEDYHNQRYLNTTYENEYAKKNVGVNVVGRRVMRDQNGKSLAPDTRDQDLLVDHGFLKPAPLSDENELKAAVKKEGYVTAQPYTFWSEKAKDGAYYNSKSTSEQAPFSRNNEFLKTYNNYTHVKY